MIRIAILSCLAVALVAVETGSPAPAFSLPAADGSSVSLADQQGKYVVLEWVNFGCPFVRKHYDSDNMQNLQKTYGGKDDVVWFTICSSAEGKQGHVASADLGATLKAERWAGTAYLLDTDGSVGKAYDAKTTPHIYVIDPEGTLIYQGGIDSIRSPRTDDVPKAVNYVTETLDAAMAGQPVPNPDTKPYGCSVKYQ